MQSIGECSLLPQLRPSPDRHLAPRARALTPSDQPTHAFDPLDHLATRFVQWSRYENNYQMEHI